MRRSTDIPAVATRLLAGNVRATTSADSVRSCMGFFGFFPVATGRRMGAAREAHDAGNHERRPWVGEGADQRPATLMPG